MQQQDSQIQRPEAQSRKSTEQAHALAALTLALDDFDLANLGERYKEAERSLYDDDGRQRLEEIKGVIVSELMEYVKSQHEAFAALAERDGLSIEIARDVALKLTDLYGQYCQIVGWPDVFEPLPNIYRAVAADVVEHFDPKIAEFSPQLRQEFSDVAQELNRLFGALPVSRDRSNSIVRAREIAAELKDAFDASIDIEHAFPWRLGKSIRTIYRKILRSIDQQFGTNIVFPEVPMDATGIVQPRGVPREW
jgi:hypothetical protein